MLPTTFDTLNINSGSLLPLSGGLGGQTLGMTGGPPGGQAIGVSGGPTSGLYNIQSHSQAAPHHVQLRTCNSGMIQVFELFIRASSRVL